MKKLFLLVPLLFAQPLFLKYTTLPPQFTMTFQNYVENEKLGPSSRRTNRFYYLYTDGKFYMKSFFQQSALIPGAPLHFKDTPVWWFVMPDPEHGGRYTARVYSEHWHQWALVAVNLGPPQQDLVSNYYAHLTIPPVPKPLTPVPVLNPPTISVNWFYTAGHNGPDGRPVLPKTNQGYFAMYERPANGYGRPYALVGGGAGAHHQAYGELVYSDFNDKPNLTPKDFIPPVGYTQVRTEEKMCTPIENELLKSCKVCHYTDPNPSNPVQLYAPFEPGTRCAH